MKKKQILSKAVEELLNNNSIEKKMDTTLFDLVSKKGLLEKPTYSFPLADTLGIRLFEATKFTLKNRK